MRVLHLTPRVPFPPLRGDQLIFFHRLRTLAERHEQTLLTLYSDPEELEGLSALREYCSRIEAVRLPRSVAARNVAIGALQAQPLQVAYFRSAELASRLRMLLNVNRYDVVHAYFLRLAPYLSSVTIPRVLELMDSLELRLSEQAKTDRAPLRWLWREELRRIRPYERCVGTLANHLIVVSDRDRATFPPDKTTVVPNGVDLQTFVPDPEARIAARVVFSGNMGYAPNVQAAKWFVNRCWRRIKAAAPDATLAIVGARPSRDVRALAAPDIEVTGYVPSIARAINSAAVAVAPLQSGSGMQNKVLEAMACARPVVTTSIARGGIAAHPGVSLVVADGAPAFTDAVIDLLRNPERAAEMGDAARDYVAANHSWDRAADLVDEVYKRVTMR